MPPTMKELERLTGFTRDKINKLIVRGSLSTKIPPVQPGEPRLFSRENFVELCYASAFEGCGMTLGAALSAARVFVDYESTGAGATYYVVTPQPGHAGLWEFVGVSLGGAESSRNEFAGLHSILRQAGPVLMLVNRPLIRQRIDLIFGSPPGTMGGSAK